MAFLPKATCRRCGREYEGFRSRCPYCGTRKVRQSERTPSTTAGLNEGTSAYARRDLNTRWQLIFAVILLVAVLLAVIVLVSQAQSKGQSHADSGYKHNDFHSDSADGNTASHTNSDFGEVCYYELC